MSVKNNNNSSDQEVKESIHEAVDKIPGLIVEQVKFAKPKSKKPTFHKPEPFTVEDKNKVRLLWLIVALIGLIILGMWSWNLFVYFKDTKTAAKNQPGLLQSAKDSFENIMKDNLDNDFTNQLKKQQAENTLPTSTTEADKEKIKTGLTNVLNVMAALKNIGNTTTTKP